MSSRPPEPLQRPAKPKTSSRCRLQEAPVQTRPQILILVFQTLQLLGLLRTHEFWLSLFRQRQEVVPMPCPHPFLVAYGNQLVTRVLADGFQHCKTRFAMGLGLRRKTLANQRFQDLENVQ